MRGKTSYFSMPLWWYNLFPWRRGWHSERGVGALDKSKLAFTMALANKGGEIFWGGEQDQCLSAPSLCTRRFSLNPVFSFHLGTINPKHLQHYSFSLGCSFCDPTENTLPFSWFSALLRFWEIQRFPPFLQWAISNCCAGQVLWRQRRQLRWMSDHEIMDSLWIEEPRTACLSFRADANLFISCTSRTCMQTKWITHELARTTLWSPLVHI